jgi:hypothetical protein
VGIAYTLGRVYVLSMVRSLCIQIKVDVVDHLIARESQRPEVGQICHRGE